MIVVYFCLFILGFMVLVQFFPQPKTDFSDLDSDLYKRYFEISGEYSRKTKIIFDFYREDLISKMNVYEKEYAEFESILDLTSKGGNVDNKENYKLSDNIKRMQIKSEKIFQLYKDIIPEFKQENRDRKLEEIIS
jgi:hypothetical protein